MRGPRRVLTRCRCGLILGGADIFPWPGGCVSAVHNEEDIEMTAKRSETCAFRWWPEEDGAIDADRRGHAVNRTARVRSSAAAIRPRGCSRFRRAFFSSSQATSSSASSRWSSR